jgi:purine-cytosine permease-like protein
MRGGGPGMVFAATMLIIIGTFQAINGLVAIIDDDFYVVRRNYTFDLDTTGWGWIHLILGIVLIVVGLALYARQE